MNPASAHYIAQAFGVAVMIVVLAKTFAWLLQLKLRNAGLVDPIWAITLGLLAVFYGAVGTAPTGLRLLLAAMGGAWGARLGIHLFLRNWNKPEDWRYAQFRQKWGARADRNMFWFFQFQNLFTLLLSSFAFLPVAFRGEAPSALAGVLAITIWVVAVAGEGIADTQMERFRADPANRGRTCRAGLWRYSRHPNYFFECVHWAAYVPLAIGASPWGWLSLAAPVVMAALLMKLSGVPLLEEEMARRKPDYADYMRRTNALIPGPPRG